MTNLDLGTSGPPETVIAPEPAAIAEALAAARAIDDPDQQRAAIAVIVAANPRFLAGWASLGDLGRDDIERYAMFRVGYHRGLDTLRQSGWRGSGYVRWRHESNRGFLRALAGLHQAASVIGEQDEAERTAVFLRQLDPEWPPAEYQ